MKLAVAIAPALTSGDSGLSPCSSNAMTELKGIPVGRVPIFARTASRPDCSSASASVKTLEIDSMAKPYRVSPASKTCPSGVTAQTPQR